MKCIVFNFVFVFRIHITSFSSNFTIISALSQRTVHFRTVYGPGGSFWFVEPLHTRELVWSLINLIKIILNKIFFRICTFKSIPGMFQIQNVHFHAEYRHQGEPEGFPHRQNLQRHFTKGLLPSSIFSIFYFFAFLLIFQISSHSPTRPIRIEQPTHLVIAHF